MRTGGLKHMRDVVGLELLVLGPVEVRRDGHAFTLPASRKTRALLALVRRALCPLRTGAASR